MNFNAKIPDGHLSAEEVSKQMRINVDILKKELTDHLDLELKRFKLEIGKALNEI